MVKKNVFVKFKGSRSKFIAGRPITKDNILDYIVAAGKLLEEQNVPIENRLWWNPETGTVERT